MENISLKNEPIKLEKNTTYIVIDSLYIDDINQFQANENSVATLSEIKEKVFSHTDFPFAIYNAKESLFKVEQIKKVNYKEIDRSDESVLSVDTGLILFIEKTIFMEFVQVFSYDVLVDSSVDKINMVFWNEITAKYKKVYLILSPGINSGVDFDGSGLYKIQ